jgi:hypothetical protein
MEVAMAVNQPDSLPTEIPTPVAELVPFQPRVMVKFLDHVPLPYVDGAESFFQGIGDPFWSSLAAQFPGITLKRMFTALTPAEINALVAQAQHTDPTYRPPNFFTFFFVEGNAAVGKTEQIADAFAAWPLVEHSLAQRHLPPTAVGWQNEPRVGTQPQIDPPPRGIGAKDLWALGADGSGVLLLDVELGWAAHEDLPILPPPVYGVSQFSKGHGTSVLGIIAALDQEGAEVTKGVIGIAPKASLALSSPALSQNDYRNEAEAVMFASSRMTFGDVMLIELPSQLTPGGPYLPFECNPIFFPVIRLATALGIIVVEAAGNGNTEIDSLMPSEDSGAILVGAATSADSDNDGVPDTVIGRDQNSNYGNRVTCFAWGDSIGTTGDGGSGTNPTTYTTSFNNTSAAAAVVAGAAVLFQSHAQSTASGMGFRLSPRQMRTMLVGNGYSTNSSPDWKIGVMPSLSNLAGPPAADIYLRDHLGDNGNTHDGAIGLSPDIILRKVPVADAEADFGETSGTRERDDLSDRLERLGTHYIYVRALNRGNHDAQNVVARLYWAEPSTFVDPSLWNSIGSVYLGFVPTGDKLKVSEAPLTWSGAPSSGHPCLIALLEDADDPAPEPTSFEDNDTGTDRFAQFLRNNNNVAMCNLKFEADLELLRGRIIARQDFQASGLNIRPYGPEAQRRRGQDLEPLDPKVEAIILQVLNDLPHPVRVRLEVPSFLMPEPLRGRPLDHLGKDSRRGFTVFENDGERLPAVRLRVPRGVKTAACRLIVDAPEGTKLEGARVGVRQTLGKWEMGRVMMELTDRKASPRRRRDE